jgi:hypothetical protein
MTGPTRAGTSDCSTKGQVTFVRDALQAWYYWYKELSDPDAGSFASPEDYLEAVRFKPIAPGGPGGGGRARQGRDRHRLRPGAGGRHRRGHVARPRGTQHRATMVKREVTIPTVSQPALLDAGGTRVVRPATDGKPVGQYGFDFCDKVVYPVCFLATNARGEADYFDGIPADCAAPDDVDHALANPKEASLAEAPHVVRYGRCSSTASAAARLQARLRTQAPEPRLDGWRQMLDAW